MTQPLEEQQESAMKAAKQIIEKSGADGVMLVVVKDGETIICPAIKNPPGLLMLMKAASKLPEELQGIAKRYIDGMTVENCDCPKCKAERESQQAETVH